MALTTHDIRKFQIQIATVSSFTTSHIYKFDGIREPTSEVLKSVFSTELEDAV